MSASGDESLLVAASSAWRAREADGSVAFHPAWHDLDEAGRRELFEQTALMRAMEAAMDPEGLSSTARAVLARVMVRR